MENRSAIRLATAALLGMGVLFSALSASASKQALVNLTFKRQFFSAGYTFSFASGTAIVTVATPTPTPSVMWVANQITGAQSFTYSGAYTPFGSLMGTYHNLAATVSKSHAGAAPLGGSTTSGPIATTKCFLPSVPPGTKIGPPHLPGSCFPRQGKIMRTPGAKKYGGTARMLWVNNVLGTFVDFTPPGLQLFSVNIDFRTPAATGPEGVGNYGIIGSGTFTNTVLATPEKGQFQETSAPHTTGVAIVTGPSFATMLTLSGSNSFNTTNLTGMISMVRPTLRQTFLRNGAGVFTGVLSLSAIETATVTFLPEPGVTLMLACGVLGLAGLAALRKH